MPSATLDTNIYVSALVYGGTPLRLLHLAIDGDLEVAISQPILDETLRILREKFGWSRERLKLAEALIVGFRTAGFSIANPEGHQRGRT